MGQPISIICTDCKTDYYLGYGGPMFTERRLYAFPIEEHIGHNLIRHCDDYTSVEASGDLHVSHMWLEPEPMVKGYRDFQQVSLGELPPIFVRRIEQLI